MQGKSKVLIVEDNPLNLELLVDLLTASDFEVISAMTAEEGIQLARQLSPQLVLMDVSLPGMDGLTATKSLKSDPLTKNSLVVALTAHAMKGDDQLALDAGCDAYLTKPINTRTIVSDLLDVLARHSQIQGKNHAA